MEEIASLMQGFATALTPFNLLLMMVGIILGVIIGVLPGLGGANGVAILMPLTFSLANQPGGTTSAIILLSCIYWGALFGGAITSILFNIPGEPWSVATTFDGYPLAQKGRADEALTAAFTSSFVGALFAVILITFLAPLVAKFALKFGPAEFFAVFFLTFASFIGMSRGSPFKVLASMCLGFALGAIGLDKVTGTLRMTYGIETIPGFEGMLNGVDFLVAVIGLFGIGEILSSVEDGLKFQGTHAKIRLNAVIETWKKLLRYWLTSIRSCVVGCWMGITPGGATPASFMSYGLAKRFSSRGDNFGNGELEGVVAPETAAHAAGTSALLPMLTLGIPGSPTAAVLLGGLMIWGLQPGPMLFVEKADFVWGLIASMYLGNIAGLIVVLTCVPLFAAILRVPFSIIAPMILVICAVGAYTVHNAMFDVWLMLAFGVVGFVFNKLGYPLPPLVLAIVLGDKAEEAFRQALLSSQGSLLTFWYSPGQGINWLSGGIMTFALVLLFSPLFSWARKRTTRALPARRPASAGPLPPAAGAGSGARQPEQLISTASGDAARRNALLTENEALKLQLAAAISAARRAGGEAPGDLREDSAVLRRRIGEEAARAGLPLPLIPAALGEGAGMASLAAENAELRRTLATLIVAIERRREPGIAELESENQDLRRRLDDYRRQATLQRS